MAASGEHTVEIVRGRIGEERIGSLVRFWTDNGVLDEAGARARLPQVVCLLLDDDGEIAGVNSVFAGRVPSIGDRRFWVYRTFRLPQVPVESAMAMLGAAFETLEQEFTPGGDDPVGACAVVSDPEEIARHPEFVWPETGFLYAGYLPNGRQLRIRYFEEARI